MRLIASYILALSLVGCTSTREGSSSFARKQMQLDSADIIGEWVSPTFWDRCSYRVIFNHDGKGCLLIANSNNLNGESFIGYYDLEWRIDGPRRLITKTSYRTGRCQLEKIRMKWLGPHIEIQSKVKGFPWQHSINLEPEKPFLDRIARTREIMEQYCNQNK